MTTIDTTLGASHDEAGDAVGNPLAGLIDWIGTSDHKRTGRLFIGSGLLALVGAAVCGVLLAIQSADGDFLDSGAVPQLQSLYIVGFTFAVLLPVMLGVAVGAVPLQVGSRSLAFPRLAQFGFCLWFVGTVLMVIMAMLNGGLFGGTDQYVALFLLSLLTMMLGLLAAAVAVVTTIWTSRAPGMNLRRVPPTTWSALVAGLAIVLGLPVVAGNLIYSWVAVRYEGVGFTIKDDVFAWVGFGFLTPVSLAYAVVAFGFLADTVATATRSRLPMRGTLFAGIALAGTGFIAAAVQNPAVLPNGMADQDLGETIGDILRWGMLSGLPLLGALVVVASVALALKSAKPRVQAPMVFGLLAAVLVLTGAAVNALAHIEPVDIWAPGIESPSMQSAWLYVVYGGVLAGLGALVYWGPKWSGRQLGGASLPLALLGFVGAAAAALPLLLADLVDDADFSEIMWWVSAAGHALVALTVLATAALVLRAGKGDVGDDPWDGVTLEWATSSPAPYDNFSSVLSVTSAEPLLDLKPADSRSDA